MPTGPIRPSRSPVWWSPLLFGLAGAALITLLVVGAVGRLTAVSIPRTAYWPLFPVAIALSLAGVVGLYPRLAAATRGWAIVGGAAAVTGTVLLVGGLAALLIAAPPGPYPASLGVFGLPFVLGLLAFVPAMGTYGVLGLRTGVPSRRSGVLMLLVAVLQFGELIGAGLVFSSAGTAAPSQAYLLFEIVVYTSIATALIGLGYALRVDLAASDTDDALRPRAVPADTS